MEAKNMSIVVQPWFFAADTREPMETVGLDRSRFNRRAVRAQRESRTGVWIRLQLVVCKLAVALI